MRRTWLVAALLALAGTPLQAVHADPPQSALAGDSTITAASSAQADLVLKEDAQLDLAIAPPPHKYDERRDFDIQGNGRFIAFVLRRAGFPDPVLTFVRYGLCHTAGCTPVDGGFFHHVTPFNQVGRELLSLPAGSYVATVVTDGAPVTVRLRLTGIGGNSTIEASRLVDVPRWHPQFTDLAGQQVVFDQQSLEVPRYAHLLVGWAYRFNSDIR